MSLSTPSPMAESDVWPARGSADLSVRAATRAPRWFLVLALAALAAYGVFLGANSTVAAGGSDSSGYLNSARLLAEGKVQTELRVPPEFGTPTTVDRYHFSPAGFAQFNATPHLPPSYPTGFPLHLALSARLAGWTVGPLAVQLGAALAALVLCYATARELGAHPALAAAAAALLASFPVFIFTSIQTLSDTLATTWALAAFYCAVRRDAKVGWAAAAGVAFAIAVLVRPTNVLLAPALVILLGFAPRRLLAFLAGGLPGAIWFCWYNHELYGGPFKSGYGTISQAFGWGYGWPTALHFAKWLALLLPGMLALLALAAFAPHRGVRRAVVGLYVAAAAIIGLYLFYDVSHDVWWCLRFILPAVAPLLVAGAVGADRWTLRWPRATPALRVGLAVILVGGAAANSWYWTQRLAVLYVPHYEQAYADAAQRVRERLPAKALVVSSGFSGAVYYYTDLPTLVYDSIKPEQFAEYAAKARAAGRGIYAVVFNIEEQDALRDRCQGAWELLERVDNIGIWELR